MKRYWVVIVMIACMLSFQMLPKKSQSPKDLPTSFSMAASMKRGKMIYLQKCLSCHQVDGGGVPHLNAPLAGATAVLANDKTKIIQIVLNGMKERVALDGKFYGNNMDSHKDLSNQQIADVLTYVRNSWTNKASAVTAAEVKVVRLKIK